MTEITPEIQNLIDEAFKKGFKKGITEAKKIADNQTFCCPHYQYEAEPNADDAWNWACDEISLQIGYLLDD